MSNLIFWRWPLGISIFVGILLAACSSTPPPMQQLDAEPVTFEEDFQAVWNAVNDVLTEKRLPVKVIERDSGLVATDFVISGARYVVVQGEKRLDERDRPISRWANETRYFVNIRVRDEGERSTSVHVMPHVEYMWYEGRVRYGWTPCHSSGDVEQELYTAIARRLSEGR